MHLLKKKKLKQKEIQEWVKASILVEEDVRPIKNTHECNWYLEHGRMIL
jgi:hypothetical protein